MIEQLKIFDAEDPENAGVSKQLELTKVKVEVNDNAFSKKINETIKKIDSLDKRLKKTLEDVKVVNEIYKKEIAPIENLFFKERLDFVFNLLNFVATKKNVPAKYQKEALTQVNDSLSLLNQRNVISEEDRKLLNEKLKVINDLHNFDLDELEEKELDFEMMQNAFEEESGVDLDLDFSDYEHLTLDEMEEMFRKKFSEHYHSQQQEDLHRKKKKQQSIDDIYFKKIYKNLIKKLHPDLQSDINVDEKKELILKLTEAWEKRDYLAILEMNQLLHGEVDYQSIPENVMNDFYRSLENKLNAKELEMRAIRNGNSLEFHWFNVLYASSKKTLAQNIAKAKYDISTATNELKRGNKEIFKSVSKTKSYLNNFLEDDEDDDDSYLESLIEDGSLLDFMDFLDDLEDDEPEEVVKKKKKGKKRK